MHFLFSGSHIENYYHLAYLGNVQQHAKEGNDHNTRIQGQEKEMRSSSSVLLVELVTDPYKKHTFANNFHKQVTLFHQYVEAKCHTDADTTKIPFKMPVSFLFQLIQLRNNGQKPTDKCIKTVCSVMYKNRVQ